MVGVEGSEGSFRSECSSPCSCRRYTCKLGHPAVGWFRGCPHSNVKEPAYRASKIMSGTIALGRATTLRGNIGSCFLSAALASTDLVCLLLCLLGASTC